MCDGVCKLDGSGAELLEHLGEAARRLRQRSRQGRSPATVAAELVALRGVIDVLELEFATGAAEFAATEEFDRQGSVSPIDWVRHHCRMSAASAATAVTVGEQAAALPQSLAALEAGEIGFGHLGLLANTARGIREAGSDFGEQPLLDQARAHSVNRFGHDCIHARHRSDARAMLAEHLDAVAARRLELRSGEGGILWLRGRFDSVGGAALRTALEPLARAAGADDVRGRERRLADALVELAEHGLDAGVLPARGGLGRPHLHVTASLETLLGLTGAAGGELEYSLPIPAATVQRMACDAGITRVLLDPASAVVDVGHSRRLPAAATRRALQVRDRGCVWPGCDRPVSWTAAHHLLHWAHGGETTLDNLVLICHRHHWLIHEGGWQLLRVDGRLVTMPPLPGHPARARAPTHVAA